MRLQLPHPDRLHRVVGALPKDEVRPVSCGQDALAEVWSVDRVPDLAGYLLGGLIREHSVRVEVGCRLLECGGPESRNLSMYQRRV